jgi:hypothetical protein
MIMKKIHKINAGFLFFSITMALILVMSACKKNNIEQNPVITAVVNYAASPEDTVVHTVAAGQWVVLLGSNLGGISQVTFNGVPATINSALGTDTSVVIQIPSIVWQSVPNDQRNVITAVNGSGVTSFEIKIVDVPLIVRIRNYEASPNDTIVSFVAPGQYVNLIGFNLEGADSIDFQGIKADLSSAVYTDSSVIVKVPNDFTGSNPSLANRFTYTTKIGKQVYFIPIVDPALLKYYADPLFTFLTGGIGKQKTWVLDMNVATGKGTVFNGPMYFSSDDLRWGNVITNNGWGQWQAEWYDWMFPLKDYGTMTFELKGSFAIQPTVKVTQKNLEDAAKNGTFTGSFFMDLDAKTMSFTDVTPMNPRRNDLDFSIKAYIISLTEDGLQLGFKHKFKPEFEILNYIVK